MRKIKKSLAVILAALMLASFMPLFASAAVTINRNNVKIVPPSVSPSVIEYGQTLADVTLTGGECWYVDPDTGAETLVPGHFEVRSTTTKPAVSEEYNLILKFVSDDTTQYSNISLLNKSTVTIKSGTWPAIKVNGLDATLVEAPTAAGIQSGEPLASAVLSGGKVTDADGNEVTGTWSFVKYATFPAASGKYQVQFSATGYNVIKTDIDVTVTTSKTATLSAAPTAKRAILGTRLNKVTLTGGKVVDENGAEVSGTWMFADDATQDSTTLLNTLGTFTYKAVWYSVGYPVFTADVSVLVAADIGYTVDKPKLSTPVPYVTGLTFDKLPFVYGEASVPGTYSTNKDGIAVVKNRNTTQSVTLTFTPDDTTLDATKWTYSFKVKENDVWYTPSEEPVKIVVPYGYSDNSVMYHFNNGNLSGALNWPDYFMEQGVNRFTWTAKDYDIASMEVGEMVLVNGAVRYNTTDVLMYSSIPESVYIQIQPGVHDDDMGSLTATYIKAEEEIALRFIFNVPGATGKVNIKYGDTVIATFTPDENGKIDEYTYFKPTQNGKYSFTAEYTPGIMDKVTIENPSVTSNSIDVKLVVERNITIKIGNEVFEFVYPEGGTFSIMWGALSSRAFENVADYWEFTDGDGNEFVPLTKGGIPVVTTQADLYFIVPEHDVIITAKTETGEDAETEESGLWGFWQKLVNFIIEIYRTIVDFFVPAMEQV